MARYRRRVGVSKLLAMQMAAAFSVPLLQWLLTHQINAKYFLLDWFFSFVYAACIGFPLSWIMPGLWMSTLRMPAAKQWLLRGAAILFAVVAGCLLGGFAPLLLVHADYWVNFKWAFLIALFCTVLITVALATYGELQGRLRVTQLALKNKEVERERALKGAVEARLASLESRIHPHFLFNTINSVSSLIHEDPDRAERLLLQMASLLRFSLDSAQSGVVPLECEMKIVCEYLEIEKARFDGRLEYEISVPSELSGVPIPPLSVQTLVENSIKHAIAPRRKGGTVKVSAAAIGRNISLEITDDGPGFVDAELPEGHGICNLRERLHALYGDAASLEIGAATGGASVRLTVPAA